MRNARHPDAIPVNGEKRARAPRFMTAEEERPGGGGVGSGDGSDDWGSGDGWVGDFDGHDYLTDGNGPWILPDIASQLHNASDFDRRLFDYEMNNTSSSSSSPSAVTTSIPWRYKGNSLLYVLFTFLLVCVILFTITGSLQKTSLHFFSLDR